MYSEVLMQISSQMRFNRYMVECESFQATYSIKSMNSFNRYMVECEYVNWSEVYKHAD